MEYTEKQMISFFKKLGYTFKEVTDGVEMYKNDIFILAALDIETIFKHYPESPNYINNKNR